MKHRASGWLFAAAGAVLTCGAASAGPSSFICPAIPTSCYDSFVTMREVVEDDSPLVLAPGFLLTTAGLNGSWLATPEQPDREAVDISGITDFLELLAHWGPCPG